MNQTYYIADEFRGGSMVTSTSIFDNLEAAFHAIETRRKDYQAFPQERRPIGFAILTVSAKFPFIVPPDTTKGSQ